MKYTKFNDIVTSSRKDEIIEIVNAYKKEHREYPTATTLEKLRPQHPQLIPSKRSIEKHGGIIVFYKKYLGLDYVDARTGIRRAKVALTAIHRSQSLDAEFTQKLVAKYGENNVHCQSPYNPHGESLHRSDFKVYKPDGTTFFIDLFFPQDMDSLQNCVNLKVKKLRVIKVEKNAPVYLVSCNEEWTTPLSIQRYLQSKKNKWPKNVKLLHVSEAMELCA